MIKQYKTMMKGKMMAFALAMMLVGCNSAEQKKVDGASQAKADSAVVETLPSEEDSCKDDKFLKLQKDLVTGESLNEIRFANWTAEDSVDNPYFREIRNFLDGDKGERNLDISEYKDCTTSKFLIGSFNSAIMGGLIVNILFIDHPQQVFDVWVYSFIDEETETVTGYEVRSFAAGERFNATPEQIRELLKEHPAKLF